MSMSSSICCASLCCRARIMLTRSEVISHRCCCQLWVNVWMTRMRILLVTSGSALLCRSLLRETNKFWGESSLSLAFLQRLILNSILGSPFSTSQRSRQRRSASHPPMWHPRRSQNVPTTSMNWKSLKCAWDFSNWTWASSVESGVGTNSSKLITIVAVTFRNFTAIK